MNNSSVKHTTPPGYTGYVSGIKANNLYGHSYSYLAKMIKTNPKFQDYPNSRLVSIQKESFVPPNTMDQTHNLVHTQKNFRKHKRWDCDKNNILTASLKKRHRNRLADEKVAMKEVINYKRERKNPVVGYTGFKPGVNTENIFGVGFQESFMLSKTTKKDRHQNKSLPPIRYRKNENCPPSYNLKRFEKGIIPGYTGYRPGLGPENVYGKTFGESNKQIRKFM